MKKIVLLFAISFVVLFSFNSCYRDTTNYDYVDINEITIDTIGFTDTVYQATSFSTVIEINPIIHATQIADPDNYKYDWNVTTTYNSVTTTKQISTERNLSLLVELGVGQHTLTFRVTDKTTGLREYINTLISVQTGVGRGCLVLCEDAEGYAQLDMVAMRGEDTVVVKNMLKDNGVPRLKGPKYIYWMGRSQYWMQHVVQISTGEGTYLLDRNTYGLATLPKYEDVFFYDPSVTDKYVLQDCISYMGSYRHVIMDGNYFSTLSSTDKFMLGAPANRYAGVYDLFNVGDKIAYNTRYSSQMPVLYNKDAKRFVVASGGSSNPSGYCEDATEYGGAQFKFNTKVDFPPNGLDYVTTMNTGNTKPSASHSASYTVLKDPATQKYYLYAYSCLNSSPTKIGRYEVTNATDIQNATLFAHSNIGSVLFYTVGAKLYGFNYITMNSKLVKDYNAIYQGSNNTITVLFYEIINPNTPAAISANALTDTFYIGMFDSSKPHDACGRVIKYENIDDPNIIQIEEVPNCNWEGLSKPVSLLYKTS